MPLRIVHVAVALLFFAAAALHRGDPEGLRWMIIYGLAGIAALRVAGGRSAWYLAGAVGAVALGWGIVWFPRVLELRPPIAAILDWHSRAPGAKEGRETLGLLAVVVWMTVIAVMQRPRASAADRR